jgi:membrane-associated phospholipid phosphatase
LTINIKKYFYPEELITFSFTLIVLAIQIVLIIQGKITAYSEFLNLLIAFVILFAFILYARKSKNKIILFLRTYLHIPYYGIIFTDFESYLHKLNPADWDWLLLKADHTIFGLDITVWLEKFNSPALTEILIISYFSYYVLPTLSAVVFYFVLKQTNHLENLRRFVLTLLIGWYAAFIFYAALPAAGPDIAFAQHYTTELKGLSPLTNYYLETVTSYLRTSDVRNTFPSMHFAILLMINYFAFKWSKKYFWFCTLPLCVGLGIATLYLRQHYLIDLIGSVFMAWFSVWAGRRRSAPYSSNLMSP